jgi:hypothetical protein
MGINSEFNPLNAKLNPICHLLALLGSRHILHVSRIRVKELNVSCEFRVEYADSTFTILSLCHIGHTFKKIRLSVRGNFSVIIYYTNYLRIYN